MNAQDSGIHTFTGIPETLERLSNASNTADRLSSLLTVDEAATFLRINRKTFYSAVQKGLVPGVIRIGRVIRIHRTALLDPSAVRVGTDTHGVKK